MNPNHDTKRVMRKVISDDAGPTLPIPGSWQDRALFAEEKVRKLRRQVVQARRLIQFNEAWVTGLEDKFDRYARRKKSK